MSAPLRPDVRSILDPTKTPWAEPPPSHPTSGVPACPTCPGRPPLEVFPRYYAVTYEPLKYCARCYGFWARGDSLSRGVADPGADHPALRQVSLTGCRSCGGRLDGEHRCRECKAVVPNPPCPSCSEATLRVNQGGTTLDICRRCEGVWFETGELPKMFGIDGHPKSLFSRAVPQPLDGEEPDTVSLIADLIAIALTALP